MKQFILLVLIIINLNALAQNPPRIRIPGGNKTMPATQGFYKPNTVFEKGKAYYSPDGRYLFTFQQDGNFVIYKGKSAIFNTHTNGIAMQKCIFQTDGNLVLYDYTNKPKWNALTATKEKTVKHGGDFFYTKGLWMTMQNDGNLVIYSSEYPATNGVYWSSDTFEKN